MSNSDSHDLQDNNKLLIKIKPINLIKSVQSEHQKPISMEDEHLAIQTKLQTAQQELEDLNQLKAQMLNEAIEDIKQEKESWENEKEILVEKAKKIGHNAGFSLGKQESMEQYKGLLDNANSIVNAVTKDYHASIEQSSNIIVKLAIHTAEKILKQHVTEQPESFLEIVVAAIKEIKDQSVISIYLHPGNYEFVLQQKDELVNLLDGNSNLSIFIDQNISENGCIIKHPFGQIDASVDTQLQHIRNVLLEVAMEDKL